MFGILFHAAVLDDGREADRNRVILPAFGGFPDLRDELLRGKLHSRIEFPRLGARDHELDMGAADIDDEDFLLHRDLLADQLYAEPELLKEPALLRFWAGRRGRPAFDDLESEKTKKGQAREFEIQSEIFRDLGDRPNAVELRGELRFRHGETKVLDALVAVAGVSRNRSRLDFRRVAQLLELDAAQCRENPVIDVFFAGHLTRILRQRLAGLENEAHLFRDQRD